MKTFKQFNEELPEPVTPKQMDVVKSDTRFIRTPDVIKKENIKFRSKHPFPNSWLPLAKKEYTGKINSDVLKAYPELNPDKPGDYIKLKKLSAKIRKAHYNPEGEVFIEDAVPTNNVGGGQIAGTVEAGDDPPKKKNKRGSGAKNRKKKCYAYGGKGSRKMWMA